MRIVEDLSGTFWIRNSGNKVSYHICKYDDQQTDPKQLEINFFESFYQN